MSRPDAANDFERRSASERLVRAQLVVPAGIERDLRTHRGARKRDQDFPGRFVLQRAKKSLDDGDRAMFTDCAEARFDPIPLAPSAIIVSELYAVVADDVARGPAGAFDRKVEHFRHAGGRRLTAEHSLSDDRTRMVVEHHGDPPAKRPANRYGKRKEAQPEAAPSRHDREIDVPQMMGKSGRHSASLGRRRRSVCGRSLRTFGVSARFGCRRRSDGPLKQPARGGWREMQTGSRQDLRAAVSAHRRQSRLERLHDVCDELRKAIDRFGQLDERVLALSSKRRIQPWIVFGVTRNVRAA